MHKIFYTAGIYTIAVLGALAYGGITGMISYNHHEQPQPQKVKQMVRSVFTPYDEQ